MYRLILTTLIGAAVAYFLDPERGENRRKQALKMFEDKTSVARDKLETYVSG